MWKHSTKILGWIEKLILSFYFVALLIGILAGEVHLLFFVPFLLYLLLKAKKVTMPKRMAVFSGFFLGAFFAGPLQTYFAEEVFYVVGCWSNTIKCYTDLSLVLAWLISLGISAIISLMLFWIWKD